MQLNKSLLGVNFFAGDVVGGIGPYLAIYLLTLQHWSPGSIGIALAAGSIATVVMQSPAGAIVDTVKWKRSLLICCAIAIACSTIGILAFNDAFAVYTAQILIGSASAFLGPLIAAVTLGLVGHAYFTRQTSANQAWNHAGNMIAAILAAILALTWSALGVFWLVAAMACGMIVCALLINKDEIDHDLARGGVAEENAGEKNPEGIMSLFEDKRLFVFAICIFLFHSANASMLPLVSQKLSSNSDAEHGVAFTAACVIAAQLVMIVMAIFCGKKADVWGRKPLLLIAFLVLPIRGILFSQFDNTYALVAIQALDGVANGIFAMVFLLVLADITVGTGRFNFAQGVLAMLIGIGASLSNIVAEYVVQYTSYTVGFLSLAATAAVGLVIFVVFMEETLVKENQATPEVIPAD
ncbi:MFS transporter [Labrenzia sp. DG1229]|uniref:MFS transporter n=1 Tax=Labrenzia sp. DG1229 TaxID=681847 RepID=UPI00048B8BBE|nr:MFS transporter [Labrenzia sp. DG1229]